MQPVLAQAAKETEELMEQIATDQDRRRRARRRSSKEEAGGGRREGGRGSRIKASARARPRRGAARARRGGRGAEQLSSSPTCQEVKSYKKPPAGVNDGDGGDVRAQGGAAEAKGAQPAGQKLADYWTRSRARRCSTGRRPTSSTRCSTFDKDNIPAEDDQVDPYIETRTSTPKKIVKKVSTACGSLCMWVRAMDTYARVAKTVEPKKAGAAGGAGGARRARRRC